MFIPDNLLDFPTKSTHYGHRIGLRTRLPLEGALSGIPDDLARMLAALKGMRHGEKALAYARAVEKDPEKTAFYSSQAKRRQTPFRLALNDAMNAPVIHQVDADEYSGRPGDSIYMKVTDDFRVTGVVVSISNAKGQLVEEGEAILLEGDHWVYRATVPHADRHKSMLRAIAFDYSGNCTIAFKKLITKTRSHGQSNQ